MRHEVSDLLRHRRVLALEAGGDPDVVQLELSRPNRSRNQNQSSIWRLHAPSRRLLRLSPRGAHCSNPRISADGRRMAWMSRRDGTAPEIHIVPVLPGEASDHITLPVPGLSSIEMWSPCGTRLLVLASRPWAEDGRDEAGDGDGRPRVVRFLPYLADGAGWQIGKRMQLLAVPVDGGEPVALVSGDFHVTEGRWSPDGRWLAYSRHRSGRLRHDIDLWLADADGGQPRVIVDRAPTAAGLAWSPDSDAIAFSSSARTGSGLMRPWLWERATGRAEAIGTRDDHVELPRPCWHPQGDRLAAVLVHRGVHRLGIFDRGGGAPRRLPVGLRQVRHLASAADHLAVVAASHRWPCEVFLTDWNGSQPRRASRINRGWIRKRTAIRVRKRSFAVPDGQGGRESVEAWLLQPCDGTGPFPLLVDLHGGPESAVQLDYDPHVFWFALMSRGWAVLAPNLVGSSGYGADFADRLRGGWGELDFPQLQAIVATLRSEGYADGRLACAGKSYGGFLAAWAIGHGDEFGAAVISAPVSNVLSHMGTSDSGYYTDPFAMADESLHCRDRYFALSPVEHCESVTAAALLLQGEDDQRCPPGQSQELFARLLRCSRAQAEMVVYPGEGHGLAEGGRPSHRLDYHGRIVDWLERHMGDPGREVHPGFRQREPVPVPSRAP